MDGEFLHKSFRNSTICVGLESSAMAGKPTICQFNNRFWRWIIEIKSPKSAENLHHWKRSLHFQKTPVGPFRLSSNVPPQNYNNSLINKRLVVEVFGNLRPTLARFDSAERPFSFSPPGRHSSSLRQFSPSPKHIVPSELSEGQQCYFSPRRLCRKEETNKTTRIINLSECRFHLVICLRLVLTCGKRGRSSGSCWKHWSINGSNPSAPSVVGTLGRKNMSGFFTLAIISINKQTVSLPHSPGHRHT